MYKVRWNGGRWAKGWGQLPSHFPSDFGRLEAKQLKDISTLYFSTPSFNPGPFNPRLFKYELFNPRFFNHEFLNHAWG